MGVSIITHKNVRIVFADYSKCQNWDERFEILEESGKVLESCSKPMPVLVDFTNQNGSREYMRRVKEFNNQYGNKVQKRAILGITGMKKVLYLGFSKLGNNAANTKPCNSKEEALEYLISEVGL